MKREDNNIFFVCSLIEYIARKTKNTKKDIINYLGKNTIQKIYELADVYHSENINKITDELISTKKILNGNYDIFLSIENKTPPSFWAMGEVYQRLIKDVTKEKKEYVDKLIEVMQSWIIEKFDNYDSSLYFENPSYIKACYVEGKII